ncbi:MAG: hypothetical protein JWQ40_4692 [Segetibacter sp.]|nr:hypothetical protein [Segetibacter sp.]
MASFLAMAVAFLSFRRRRNPTRTKRDSSYLGITNSCYRIIQKIPLRIKAINQINLLTSSPTFNVLFSINSMVDVLETFKVD